MGQQVSDMNGYDDKAQYLEVDDETSRNSIVISIYFLKVFFNFVFIIIFYLLLIQFIFYKFYFFF